MKKVVVDASIAIKWAVNEHDSSVALALLKNWTDNEVTLLAPSLLMSEAANTLYRAVNKGLLPFKDAELGLEKVIFPAITFDLMHIYAPDFFVHLIELASQFNLAATYDAHYLALAERENCEFWTAD